VRSTKTLDARHVKPENVKEEGSIFFLTSRSLAHTTLARKLKQKC
jgi:hypothetical protein